MKEVKCVCHSATVGLYKNEMKRKRRKGRKKNEKKIIEIEKRMKKNVIFYHERKTISTMY